MFERYTERARRSIFFARYEASALFTSEITAEELLLGILREDKTVASRLGLDALIAIRRELEQLALPHGGRIPTSVDLPLSHESKRALEYAAEEADALQHKMIDSAHLVLGLMRVEACLAATLLRKHGVEYDSYRVSVEGPVGVVAVDLPPGTPLEGAAQALQQLVDNTLERVQLGNADGDQRLKRRPWTRKEALAHLIDWGMAHHQWLLQARSESKVAAAGYPDESTAAIAPYADFHWPDAVDLWVSLNRLLVHLLKSLPEDKMDVPCRIGIAAPVPLAKLMDTYVEHCQDVVGQILARLD